MTAADPPVRHPVSKARVELAGQSDLVVTGHKRDSFAPAIVILRQGDDDGWVLPPGKALSLACALVDVTEAVLDLSSERSPDERRVFVRKAQPIGGNRVPSAEIVVDDVPPSGDASVDAPGDRIDFDRDAQALLDCLRGSLPGGTFDRLVVRMLETRTSDLVVRRASPDDR